MNRTELNALVYDIVGDHFDADESDTALVIEEALFQVRHALVQGAEIDLDYLGVLKRNDDGTYAYDPRVGAGFDVDDVEDGEERKHADAN